MPRSRLLQICVTLIAFSSLGGQPAARADDPPLPPEAEQYLAQQQTIFETLFGDNWTNDDWVYPLAQRIEGPGDYVGMNNHGQGYFLHVTEASEIDLAAAGLTPEQLQTAIEQQVSMRTIQGSIQGPLGLASFQGVATSGYLDGQFVSYFVIAMGSAASNRPPALTQPANVDPGGYPPLIIQPSYPELPSEQCALCDREYNETVAIINALYEAQVSAAERDREAADLATAQNLEAIWAANEASRQSSVNEYSDVYVVTVVGCGVLSPLGQAVCFLTATALYGISVTHATTVRDEANAAAEAAAMAEYNDHLQTYLQRVGDALRNAEAQIAIARLRLTDCYEFNGCGINAL